MESIKKENTKPKRKELPALDTNPYNAFFNIVTRVDKYNLEFLRLSLPPELFAAFDWETLTSEACTYTDKQGREKRTDLILSARFKQSQGAGAKVIYLVEHKAQKNPREVLLQLLGYQNTIYQNTKGPLVPIVPIIIYNGKTKTYSGPVKLYDILESPKGEMNTWLKRFVLDFECCFLNVHDLNMEEHSDSPMAPILYIMQSIFKLDKGVVRKLLAQGEHLPKEEWSAQIGMALDHIMQVDPNFTRKILEEIVTEEKGEKTVTLLEKGLNQMISEGIEEGMEKGLEKGRQEGRQEGREEGRREIAKTLLADGAEPKFVAKTTGLTLAEVKKLAKK